MSASTQPTTTGNGSNGLSGSGLSYRDIVSDMESAAGSTVENDTGSTSGGTALNFVVMPPLFVACVNVNPRYLNSQSFPDILHEYLEWLRESGALQTMEVETQEAVMAVLENPDLVLWRPVVDSKRVDDEWRTRPTNRFVLVVPIELRPVLERLFPQRDETGERIIFTDENHLSGMSTMFINELRTKTVLDGEMRNKLSFFVNKKFNVWPELMSLVIWICSTLDVKQPKFFKSHNFATATFDSDVPQYVIDTVMFLCNGYYLKSGDDLIYAGPVCYFDERKNEEIANQRRKYRQEMERKAQLRNMPECEPTTTSDGRVRKFRQSPKGHGR